MRVRIAQSAKAHMKPDSARTMISRPGVSMPHTTVQACRKRCDHRPTCLCGSRPVFCARLNRPRRRDHNYNAATRNMPRASDGSLSKPRLRPSLLLDTQPAPTSVGLIREAPKPQTQRCLNVRVNAALAPAAKTHGVRHVV